MTRSGVARMRWGWPAATGRSRLLPRPRRPTTFPSCAFRPAHATISRSTWASTGTTWRAHAGSTDGLERRIDVAEVNGRLFLNNVSLGLYGHAVQQPGYREPEVWTLLETAEAVLGPSGAAPELHLMDDLGREHTSPGGRAHLQQPLRSGLTAGDRHSPGP